MRVPVKLSEKYIAYIRLVWDIINLLPPEEKLKNVQRYFDSLKPFDIPDEGFNID